MLMVAGATTGYEIFIYLYRGFILQSNIEFFLFIRVLIIEIIFNTLITIIIYPLMQKFRIQNRRNI